MFQIDEMEAVVEKNLKEEAYRLELMTKKLNTLNVIQVTPVSIISCIIFYKISKRNFTFLSN